MPVYSIPIHGLIGSPESPEDKALYFPFDAFLMHVNKAREFDTLELDIASDGGYVDVTDKMIDVLKGTKKPITAKNSGNVASAASKLFTLAPKGSRNYDPAKGVFLIHNPWGTIEGDANELAAASKALQDTENEYAKWYASSTGSDLTVIKSFMQENIPLTPEQVEQLGFATIVRQTVNAVAKLKSSNINQMENKEIIEKLNGFETFLQKIFGKIKMKALMLADANGKELDFPDITDISEIAVGVKVNEGGKPAEGEYPQPDGTVIVCKAGVIAEIKPKADDSQALEKENAELKAEIEKLKSEKVSAEANATNALSVANEVKAEFKRFKSQFSAAYIAGSTPPAGEKTESKKLSKTELENLVN